LNFRELSVAFMAEETPIFGGMAFREGGAAFRGMTFGAELFRLFFVHILKPAMIGVFRQFCRGLLGRVKKKEEDGGAGDQKRDVQIQGFYSSFGRLGHGVE
jgi:hypothetical protein